MDNIRRHKLTLIKTQGELIIHVIYITLNIKVWATCQSVVFVIGSNKNMHSKKQIGHRKRFRYIDRYFKE